MKPQLQSGWRGRYTIVLASSIVHMFLFPRSLDERNFAFHKPTWQSSTDGDSVSSRVVDGSQQTTPGSCSQTDGEDSPWWIVDLQSQYIVTHVLITSTDRVGKHIFRVCELVKIVHWTDLPSQALKHFRILPPLQFHNCHREPDEFMLWVWSSKLCHM